MRSEELGVSERLRVDYKLRITATCYLLFAGIWRPVASISYPSLNLIISRLSTHSASIAVL